MQSSIPTPPASSTAPREIGGHTLRARKPVEAKPPAPKRRTKAPKKEPTVDPPVVPVPTVVLPAVPPELDNVPEPRAPTRWFRHGVLQPGPDRSQRVNAAPTTARARSTTSARSGSRTAVELEEPQEDVKPKPSRKALGKRKATALDDIPEAREEEEATSQVPPAKRPRRRPAATPRPRARKRT